MTRCFYGSGVLACPGHVGPTVYCKANSPTVFQLNMARQVVTFDTHDMNNRPDCEMILTDWIHEVVTVFAETF